MHVAIMSQDIGSVFIGHSRSSSSRDKLNVLLRNPARRWNYIVSAHFCTCPLQAQHALAVAAAAVSWGTPYALWWTFYDNTKTIKDAETGVYQDRGFGLGTNNNQDTVLYNAFKEYFTEANAWLYNKIQVCCIDGIQHMLVTVAILCPSTRLPYGIYL